MRLADDPSDSAAAASLIRLSDLRYERRTRKVPATGPVCGRWSLPQGIPIRRLSDHTSIPRNGSSAEARAHDGADAARAALIEAQDQSRRGRGCSGGGRLGKGRDRGPSKVPKGDRCRLAEGYETSTSSRSRCARACWSALPIFDSGWPNVEVKRRFASGVPQVSRGMRMSVASRSRRNCGHERRASRPNLRKAPRVRSSTSAVYRQRASSGRFRADAFRYLNVSRRKESRRSLGCFHV